MYDHETRHARAMYHLKPQKFATRVLDKSWKAKPKEDELQKETI